MSMSLVPVITVPAWLSISTEGRKKIAEWFSLKRDGVISTRMGAKTTVVLSDGYTQKELSKITLEGINARLSKEFASFWEAAEALVQEAEGTNVLFNVAGERPASPLKQKKVKV